MDYRYLIVKLAHPYNDNGMGTFDIFDLSDELDVCLYIAETNKNHQHLISLTPIQHYAVRFPVDSIKEIELKKLKNKRTFDFNSQLLKAQGFATFVKMFIHYLDLCKLYQNKYYIKFGRNKIICKKDKYFINGAHYFYAEIINMIFTCAWEYENLKLCKYNLFKRLFS